MKIILLILVALATMGPLAHAQRLTPLQHLTMSNALIERPETFRAMQIAIEKEWGNTRKGVQLQLLDDRMTMFRETVVALFDKSKVSVEPGTIGNTNAFKIILAIEQPHFKDSILIPKSGISMLGFGDTLKRELATRLRGLFRLAAERATDELSNMNAPVLQDVVQTALRLALDDAGVDGGDVADRLASLVTRKVLDEMREHMRSINPAFNPGNTNFWPTRQGEIISDTMLGTWLRTGVRRIGETVAGALDQAENSVRSVVDRFNRLLLSANAGLSVAQGQGDFGAGIHVSYTWNTHLQLGAFINGEFQPDSTKSAVGLFGGQVRYAGDAWQFDALVSALRGENWGLEAGLGLSFRSSPSVLVGFGVFGSVLPVELLGSPDSTGTAKRTSITGWSTAFTVRGADPSSPTLVIGASKVDGAKITPLLQIVYPINARL